MIYSLENEKEEYMEIILGWKNGVVVIDMTHYLAMDISLILLCVMFVIQNIIAKVVIM